MTTRGKNLDPGTVQVWDGLKWVSSPLSGEKHVNSATGEDGSSTSNVVLLAASHTAGMYSIGGFLNVTVAATEGIAQLFAEVTLNGSPTSFALGPPIGLTAVGAFAMPPVNVYSEGTGDISLSVVYSGVVGTPDIDVWGMAV